VAAVADAVGLAVADQLAGPDRRRAAEAGALPDVSVAAGIADRLLPHASRLALQGGIGAMAPTALYLG
jgi:hypothetical protein